VKWDKNEKDLEKVMLERGQKLEKKTE